MILTRRDVIVATVGLISGAVCVSAFGKGRTSASGIIKVSAPYGSVLGTLEFNGCEYPCVLGRSGIVHSKHEGDGGTPEGIYPLREVRYRVDRVAKPRTGLPVFQTKPDDGWCDEPTDPAYNRLVRMPYKADAEIMWRTDHLYDVLAVIGYNDAPPVPGAGSAIFLHVVRTAPDGSFLPTAGCIAMTQTDILSVLATCKHSTLIDIRRL